MDASPSGKIKVCPQCGTSFSCTPVGCWCSELPPVMPLVDGAECYCPACLKKIVEQKLAEVS